MKILLVGCGLFNATIATQLKNHQITIIDKRNHIGGNCYTINKDNINIHQYGAHIFHTDDENIWNLVNKYISFNNYRHKVLVNYNNKIYSFPINLLTLQQVYPQVQTPQDANQLLNSFQKNISRNLEEHIISEIGLELYEIFIKGYTQKQWNTHPKNLPISIIKRLPIRTNFNDLYFNDKFQGIPIGGYTSMIDNMISHCDIKLNTDYFDDVEYFNNDFDKIIFSGPIDRFYNYKFGKLQWRSLKFEEELHEIQDYQGTSVINYTSEDITHTRIIEHKHFEFEQQPITYITKEYPENYIERENDPIYPINDENNNKIYNQYKEMSKTEDKILFGGRLGDYAYYDMDDVINKGIELSKSLL